MKKELPTISIRKNTSNRKSLFIGKANLTRKEIDLLKKDSSYVKLWIIKHIIINLKYLNKPEIINQIEYYDTFVKDMK